MDTLRGQFDSLADSGGHDASDDEIAISTSLRLHQVRPQHLVVFVLEDVALPH